MRGIVVSVGALLALLSCGGGAQAGVAGGDSALSRAALLGKQGFVQEFISAGNVQENTPILLAKKRKKKKSAKGGYVSTGGGGGAIQIDPNTDELKKLMMLPLIDQEEAQAIIEYRKTNRIDTPEEIMEIKGIEPTKYRIFKHLIVIREEAKPAAESREKESKEAPEGAHAPPPPQKEQEPQKTH